MRKMILAVAATAAALTGLASPAAADSAPNATVEWQEQPTATNRIQGTLGPHTVSTPQFGPGVSPTNTITVDWVNSDATDAVTAGGVSSSSAGLVASPTTTSNLKVIPISPAMTDPVLLIVHGVPGVAIDLPSGTEVLDSNNVSVGAGDIYTFTSAATGSVDDGLAVRYAGSRTALVYAIQNSTPNFQILAFTLLAPAPVAEDALATTAADTPVTVTPAVTPPAGRTVDPALTRLMDGSTAVTTLTNSDGTYEVDPEGTITFTPAPGFTGLTQAVVYRVTDSAGITGSASLLIDVVPVVGVPLVSPFVLLGAIAILVPTALLIRRRRATV